MNKKMEKYLKGFEVWLLFLIPEDDKLKHFFLGALGFVFLNLFFNDLNSLLLVFIFSFVWEIFQKIGGGTNTKKGMALDILFGILMGLLINIVNFINQITS